MKAKQNRVTLSVVVADDHEIIRRGLKNLLTHVWPGIDVVFASTLDQTLSLVQQKTNLIIIDTNIQGGNNLKMVNEIKSIQPNAKILIFTSLNENIYAVPYLKAGAYGFLSKNARESEIVSAITVILAGGRYSSKIVKENMFNSLLGNDAENPFTKLSPRELEVAEFLAKGVGVLGISNKLNLRMGTVSTYKLRLFQKLKIKSVIELAEKMTIYEK